MNIGTSGSFTRNLLTLLGGTAIAQSIPLLAAPLLTRMYSPAQFGALAILLAVANPLSLIVCGRYDLTVVLPREDDRANVLARLGLLMAASVSLVLGLVLWFFHGSLASMLGGEAAMTPLLLAPFLFFFMGFFQPLNNWLIRKQAFRAMSVNKLMQTTGITLVSLALGWWSYEHGLLVGYTTGWGLYVIFGAAQVRWKEFRFRPLDLAAMRDAAKAYRSFPLYNALPAVLNTATLSIPIFMLTRMFSEDVTGQFNLCRQTVFLPLTFFATSFMQVYMQRASSTVAEGKPVLPAVRRSMRLLAGMAIMIALVLIVSGPWLFGLVFGSEWTIAGNYARILAVPIALQFIVIPLTPLLPALGRIRAYSIWQVCYFSLVLLLGVATFTLPVHYLVALSVVESLCFMVLAIMVLRSARSHDAQLAA